MDPKTTKEEKTLATILHLSVFSKFILPLGNFIFPLILWLLKKEKSFIDDHGRRAINFQISLFLYAIFIISLGTAVILFQAVQLGDEVPFIMDPESFSLNEVGQAVSILISISIVAILLVGLFILEIFAVLSACIKANNGENFSFPLCINFIGKDSDTHHFTKDQQSKNEQFKPQNQTL